MGRGIKETGRISRTNLKTEEDGVPRKTGFPGRHANVCRIVTRHILCVGADDHRDNERLAVNGVCRDHQDGTSSRLFPAVGGTEIHEVDLAVANHPSARLPRRR